MPDVVALTRRLIRCNTVNPPGNEEECARLVAHQLEDAGFAVRSQIVWVKPKMVLVLTPRMLAVGASLGLLLGLGYVTQTVALQLTTAAITGFLTGTYVVLTPVIGWLLFRHRIGSSC